MIKFDVKITYDAQKTMDKAQQALNKAQLALDEQILKDSNNFIPKDTGALEQSSLRFSRTGEGHIEWNTPYARRLYYNPQYNFSQDKNPNAQGLWFEEAKARHGSDWEKIAQHTVNQNMG
ncbi:minor capsid protein [Ectobacillus antri]|uniref:minor capsid protein n=1 Tax=Ectobacillus antri TaxID=2486280 RepID=UPI000F593E7C|nr:minor capsid protein [Ectobacillus antri]